MSKITKEKRLEILLKEEAKLYKKYHILKKFTIHFPKKNKVPLLSKIAVRIVSKQGGEINTQYLDNVVK